MEEPRRIALVLAIILLVKMAIRCASARPREDRIRELFWIRENSKDENIAR
jgi:hypothetical protein